MKGISETQIFRSRLTAKRGSDSWPRSGTYFGLCCEERSASRAHLDCCWHLGSVFHRELFERSEGDAYVFRKGSRLHKVSATCQDCYRIKGAAARCRSRRIRVRWTELLYRRNTANKNIQVQERR